MSTEDNARIESLEEQSAITQESLSRVAASVETLASLITADREEAKNRELQSQRATKITALCAQCGVDSTQATEWISDECLSIEDVKDKLLARKFEQSPPAGDGGGSESPNDDELLSREYDQHASDHRALGIKKADWVAEQKRLKSDDEEFEYMSPEWAESLLN